MKKLFIFFALMIMISATAFSQPERIGAGLSFTTKKRFNGGDTGNPGLNIKTWIAVNKNRTFYVVPSVALYNTVDVNHTSYITTNHMFHGDLDFQYQVFKEETIKLAAIAGVNYTHINSKNQIVFLIPNQPVIDSSIYGIGPVIGAALEMRMSSNFDFILSGKYSFAGLKLGDPALEQRLFIAPLSSPIIQIHAVYYFTSRSKGYSRR